MAEVSEYNPSMLIWIDEDGCDRRNSTRKYGYSDLGIRPVDHRLLICGTRYSAIPVMSVQGIHDVFLAKGSANGERFELFIRNYLLPVLMPFNGINPLSVVILDNASHRLQLSLNLRDSPEFLATVPRPGRLYYNCIIGPGRGPDTGINTVVVVQLITYWW